MPAIASTPQRFNVRYRTDDNRAIIDRRKAMEEAEYHATKWLDKLEATWGRTGDWTLPYHFLRPAQREQLDRQMRVWQERLYLPKTPTVKQLAVLLAPERGIDQPILFGGGMGGAKSACLVMAAIRAARTVPNNRVLLARSTYASLATSTRLELEEQISLCDDAIHEKGYHRIYFPQSNSYIWYAGIGGISERQRIRSSEYGFIGIDEVTEVTEDVSNEVSMRLRWGPAEEMNALQMLYTCNPEPGWVKQQFISDPRPGFRFIRALPVDNPYLNNGNYLAYIESVRKRQPKEWFDAYILGNWDAFVPTDAAIPEPMLREMARRIEEPDPFDCVWGVDVARGGADWTTVWRRRGTVFDCVGRWRHTRTTDTVQRILWAMKYAYPKPWRMNIDDGGVGGGVSDQLIKASARGMLGTTVVGQVVAGGRPDTDDVAGVNYFNKRAEAFALMRRLLEQGYGSFSEATNGHLMENVIGDLTTPRAFQASRRGRPVFAVEQKPEVKSRLGRSPDDGDGLLLTLHEGHRDYVGTSVYGTSDEELHQRDLAEQHRIQRLRDGIGKLFDMQNS